MSSTEPLASSERQKLLELARTSIREGLETGQPTSVTIAEWSPVLQQERASFVTLHLNDRLRGCIGTIEAHQPLVQDVSEHAYAAAFRDPRFPPLKADELPDVGLEISVLSVPEPINPVSEQQLLEQLRPGLDGLILEDRAHRSTFLPTVWSSLAEPADFLAELKRKAGLAADHWSPTLRFWRYQTECFREGSTW